MRLVTNVKIEFFARFANIFLPFCRLIEVNMIEVFVLQQFAE